MEELKPVIALVHNGQIALLVHSYAQWSLELPWACALLTNLRQEFPIQAENLDSMVA